MFTRELPELTRSIVTLEFVIQFVFIFSSIVVSYYYIFSWAMIPSKRIGKKCHSDQKISSGYSLHFFSKLHYSFGSSRVNNSIWVTAKRKVTRCTGTENPSEEYRFLSRDFEFPSFSLPPNPKKIFSRPASRGGRTRTPYRMAFSFPRENFRLHCVESIRQGGRTNANPPAAVSAKT